MGSNKKVENAVGAIIVRDSDVLLVKRKKHFTDAWTLPVGILEFGETARDCIVREVREELGVVFFSPTFCGYSDDTDVLPDRHFVVLYFFGAIRGEIVLDENELTGYRWFSLNDALNMRLGFGQEKILQMFAVGRYE